MIANRSSELPQQAGRSDRPTSLGPTIDLVQDQPLVHAPEHGLPVRLVEAASGGFSQRQGIS